MGCLQSVTRENAAKADTQTLQRELGRDCRVLGKTLALASNEQTQYLKEREVDEMRINRFTQMLAVFAALAIVCSPFARVAYAVENTGPSGVFPRGLQVQSCAGDEVEKSRCELRQQLEKMAASIEMIKESEFAKAAVDDSALDPARLIEKAREDVQNASDEEIIKAKADLDKRHPRWRESASKLDGAFTPEVRDRLSRLPRKPKNPRGRGNGPTAVFSRGGLDGLLAFNGPGGVSRNVMFGSVAPNESGNGSPFRGLTGGLLASRSSPRAFDVDPDTCDPGPGTPLGVTDVQIAKGVALAGEIAMEYIPSDSLPTNVIVRSVATSVWAAASIALLVLESLNAVESECLAAKFEQSVSTSLTNIGNSFSDITSAINGSKTDIINNSNVNLNRLITAIDESKNAIINNSNVNLDTTLTSVTNSKTAVINNANANLSTVLAAISNSKTEVINNANANLTTVVTSINNSRNEVINNANANLGTIVTAIDAAKGEIKDLLLRTQIMADLAEADSATPVAWYLTPSDKGGHLDLVRSIVAETIANIQAASGNTGQAQSFLTQGDAYKAAGNFKAAYASYRRAFKQAAN